MSCRGSTCISLSALRRSEERAYGKPIQINARPPALHCVNGIQRLLDPEDEACEGAGWVEGLPTRRQSKAIRNTCAYCGVPSSPRSIIHAALEQRIRWRMSHGQGQLYTTRVPRKWEEFSLKT
jgi:hypothetical protein